MANARTTRAVMTIRPIQAVVLHGTIRQGKYPDRELTERDAALAIVCCILCFYSPAALPNYVVADTPMIVTRQTFSMHNSGSQHTVFNIGEGDEAETQEGDRAKWQNYD